ncbi:hypothetical protein GCM10009111_18310 [Colwellia asteriadis]|uniref:Uncharacterized protein n=1 Tax=Colwellia asteriadis TaxID=517723 RepID=A0ABN1L721_9GAMM
MKKLLRAKYVVVMVSALLFGSVNAIAASNEGASSQEDPTVFCINFPAGFGYKCFKCVDGKCTEI